MIIALANMHFEFFTGGFYMTSIDKISGSFQQPHLKELKAEKAHHEHSHFVHGLFSKINEFFYLNFTKAGQLEKKEATLIKKLNGTQGEIRKGEKKLRELVKRLDAFENDFKKRDPHYHLPKYREALGNAAGKLRVGQYQKVLEESHRIDAELQRACSSNEKTLKQLEEVMGKIKALRDKNQGLQTVVKRLDLLQKDIDRVFEEKIESEDQLLIEKGVTDLKAFESILNSIFDEYKSVIKAHPELEKTFVTITNQMFSSVMRLRIKDLKNEKIKNEKVLEKQVLELHKYAITQNPYVKQEKNLTKKIGELKEEAQQYTKDYRAGKIDISQADYKVQIAKWEDQDTQLRKERGEVREKIENSKPVFARYEANIQATKDDIKVIDDKISDLERYVKPENLRKWKKLEKLDELKKEVAKINKDLRVMHERGHSTIPISHARLKAKISKLQDEYTAI